MFDTIRADKWSREGFKRNESARQWLRINPWIDLWPVRRGVGGVLVAPQFDCCAASAQPTGSNPATWRDERATCLGKHVGVNALHREARPPTPEFTLQLSRQRSDNLGAIIGAFFLEDILPEAARGRRNMNRIFREITVYRCRAPTCRQLSKSRAKESGRAFHTNGEMYNLPPFAHLR